MAFLRPQSLTDFVRYQVCIPDAAEWRTQLWGAISLLLESWQWEGDSALSDDEIGAEYLSVLNSFERCPMAAGLILAYGGTSAPGGYLLCDGSSYASSDYPILFDAIGYDFGGSGPNFNVPDLRENFPLGAGGGVSVGDIGGAPTHTLTENQTPGHVHDIPPTFTALAQLGVGAPVKIPSLIPAQTGSTGGGESHNNMPPYLALNFIISIGNAC